MYLSHLSEPIRQRRCAASDISQSFNHPIELKSAIEPIGKFRTSQAVLYDTPRCRDSANADKPFLLWVSREIARNQVVKGSLVFSNSVRAVSEDWWWQR